MLRRSGEGRRSDPRQRHCAAAIRPQEEIPPICRQDISTVGGPENRYGTVEEAVDKKGPRWFTRVCVFLFASSGELMMSLFWYYRPEHTQGGRDPSTHCEVRLQQTEARLND